jgi:alkylation response protein AidB-like acyl-CoA dehydrogenase
MDFEYSAEQLQLRKSIRDFATAELAPHTLDWDENQIFPLEAIKKPVNLVS